MTNMTEMLDRAMYLGGIAERKLILSDLMEYQKLATTEDEVKLLDKLCQAVLARHESEASKWES